MSPIKALLQFLTPIPPSRDYWTPLPAKNTSYSELVVQFIRAIIRLHETEDYGTDFSFMLHENQENALLALITVLNEMAQGDVHTLDGEAMRKLHEFFWALMDATSVHQETNWGNVIQRFICLKALRHDGNFYESTDLTPDLAKLTYFLNASCLIHALWYQKDSDIPQFQSVLSPPSSFVPR